MRRADIPDDETQRIIMPSLQSFAQMILYIYVFPEPPCPFKKKTFGS